MLFEFFCGDLDRLRFAYVLWRDFECELLVFEAISTKAEFGAEVGIRGGLGVLR